jgi:hypothetical protein
VDEFGRELRRSSPPRQDTQDPSDEPYREGEQDELGDEAPQIVVLKEGKHLTAEEAENERRKGESSN